MEEFLKLIWSTVILRPYVFAFLIAYIFIGYTYLGWKRLGVYTIIAWTLAFLSELSSINNGFPYGHYEYTYLTQIQSGIPWEMGSKELYLFGVIPFIDSLSYTFLTFTGYALAIYVLSPVYKVKSWILSADTLTIRYSIKTAIVGAILITFMDVIIDPIATMGDQWFLGKIHTYTDKGDYFGVPLTNTLGWFFTSLVILISFQKIDRWLNSRGFYYHSTVPNFKPKLFFLIGLYVGIIVFNLAVTFSIGENRLGIAGIYIEIPILLFLIIPLFSKKHSATRDELDDHYRDFPNFKI